MPMTIIHYEQVKFYREDPLIWKGGFRTRHSHVILESCDDAKSQLHKIRIPVLVTQGALDRLVDSKGAEENIKRFYFILTLTTLEIGEPSPPRGDTGPGRSAILFWSIEKLFCLVKNGIAFYLGPELPSRTDGSSLHRHRYTYTREGCLVNFPLGTIWRLGSHNIKLGRLVIMQVRLS